MQFPIVSTILWDEFLYEGTLSDSAPSHIEGLPKTELKKNVGIFGVKKSHVAIYGAVLISILTMEGEHGSIWFLF